MGILRTFCTRKSDACGQERPKATLGVTERFVHPIAPPSFLSGWRASSSTNCHHLTAAGRAVSLSGSGRGRGQEERAGGSGNLEPAEASVMRPALPWRRTSTIHRAAVVQSRGASGSDWRGWGGDWWGVAGQQDQAGWVAQHPEAPPAPRRRRRLPRSAARAPGGAPAGQDQSRGVWGAAAAPPAIRAAPQAKFWKIAKKLPNKILVFRPFLPQKNASNFSAARPLCPQGTR